MTHFLNAIFSIFVAGAFLIGCGAPKLPEPTTGLGSGAVVVQPPEPTLERPQPWLLEWGADARKALASELASGLVLVQYRDGVLELLPGCHLEGEYTGGVSQSRPVDEKTLSSNMDLRAKLGIQLVTVKGAFEKGEAWSLKYTVADVKSATEVDISLDSFPADCTAATHYISAVYYGAYILDTGAFREVSGGGEVKSVVDANASSGGDATLVRKDGDYDKCQELSTPKTDVACGGLLKIGLSPIGEQY